MGWDVPSGVDVAPFTPFLAASWKTDTSLVDEEVGGYTGLFKVRGQSVDEVEFVPGGAVFSIGLTDGSTVRVLR